MNRIDERADLSPEEKRALVAQLLQKRTSQPKSVPLSFAQERLWFLDQLTPGSGLYNVPIALKLDGSLSMGALERSLQEIVRRHEILRSRIVTRQGKPEQQIARRASLTLALVDLCGVSPSEQQTVVLTLADGWMHRPFNLAEGSLLRVCLLRQNSTEHVLLIVMHHIVSDGWSVGVMLTELWQNYQSFSTGRSTSLSDLSLQYSDYALWQRQRFTGEILDQQISYWHGRLADSQTLELPTERRRRSRPSYRGGMRRFNVSAESIAALRRLSQSQDATLFMTLFTAWALLLGRYSGQTDISVGTPMAGRTRAELEELIGVFVNTVVLRVDLTGRPTFLELLGRVRQIALEAYDHQDLPFEKVVDELAPVREAGYNPLYQVVFALHGAPAQTWNLGDLTAKLLEFEIKTARFDLEIHLMPGATEMRGQLVYSKDVFGETAISRLVGHFQTLLESVAAGPGKSIWELSFLTEAERRQLLIDWNSNSAVNPLERCVHYLFESEAERRPDEVALVFGSEKITYGQLNQRANQLAHYLLEFGAGPEVLIAVCTERSIEMVIGLLGILKAGATYVPLDPTYPIERLAVMLQDGQISVLLTQDHLLDRLPAHWGQFICLDTDWSLISVQSSANPVTQVVPDNLAYVIYTSGSTGQPKGVEITHRSLLNLIKWHQDAYALSASDRATQLAGPAFDASVWELWPYLTAGASIYIPDETTRLSPAKLIEWLAENEITVSFIPTPLAEVMLEHTWPEKVALRAMLTGGDKLHRGPRHGLAFRLINHYGPTENTVVATCGVTLPDSETENATPHIGRPITNTQAYLLDSTLAPTPIGVPGGLFLGGTGLARGYRNRPMLTAKSFIPNPFSPTPGSRLYRTGDWVRYLADANIEFLGRVDDQVKVRGFRIELGEIETALAQHPAIREVAVVAREDDPGEKRLVAYVVASDVEVPSASELRSFLSMKLPDHALPAAFVWLDSLPLTANGKIDRRILPRPETERKEEVTGYRPPNTHAEKILVEIWREVLRIERVGVTENFFELGGDSILSIQVIARAQVAGLRLTPRQMFESQTIAELAAAAGTAEDAVTDFEEEGGSAKLTPIQGWFFEQDLIEPNHFNQSLLLEAAQKIELGSLTQAVAALIEQQESLRMRFISGEDGWVGEAEAREQHRIVGHVDLSGLSETNQREALLETCEQAQRSLDLARGPVVRLVLVEMGSSLQRLLFTAHHLVIDGVSWRIVLDDLATALGQLAGGRHITLPPMTSSYRRWVDQLYKTAAKPEIHEQRSYWLTQAAGTTTLPVDYRDGSNLVGGTRSVTAVISESDTQTLLQVTPRVYRTQIVETLLAALAPLLCKWSRADAVVIELEGHGREDIEGGLDVTRTVGWFTSVFPVRLSPAGAVGAQLKQVKEQIRQIPNRGISYGLLRYLNDDPAIRLEMASIKAQLSFNYLGQFDQVLGQDQPWQTAPEGSGSVRNSGQHRALEIEVIAAVTNGRLHVSWNYSGQRYRRETIERLADGYLEALREIAEHCRGIEFGGYTSSDFPLAGLTQSEIDEVIGQDRQIEDVYPLSPMQAGLLFHSLYAPRSGVYVVQMNLGISGPVDVQSMRKAWQAAIDRHPILRTSFIWRGLSEPMQVVRRGVEIPFEAQDWRAFNQSEQSQRLAEFLRVDRETGFALDQAPLMRLSLLQTADQRHQLIWTHHHMILDGWSLPILLQEIFALYSAYSEGNELSLAARRPYRDYVHWLQQQDMDEAERFWRAELAEIIAPTRLGVDGVDVTGSDAESPGAEETAYGEQQIQISSELTGGLRQLARERQITLNTLLQAIWALLLSRYSGQSDVVYGAVVSGRPANLAGVEEMVGPFINTLPVRITVPTHEPAGEWLRRLQAQQARLRLYEYTPLVQIQGWSEVPRGMQLFESILAFENYPVDSAFSGELVRTGLNSLSVVEQPNYPLTVVVGPGAQIGLKLLYDRQRFEPAAIDRVLGHLVNVMRGLAANPSQPVAHLPWLSESERQCVLHDWNDTRMAFGDATCVHKLFELYAAENPDSPAIVGGEFQLSYRELNQQANRLAHYLLSEGIVAESLIAICLKRSPLLVIAEMAVLKAGGAYLPLDPGLPGGRIRRLCEVSGARLVLTETSLVSHLGGVSVRSVVLDGTHRPWTVCNPDNPETEVDPENLAYVIYTSGSTGEPKGVQVSHCALHNLARWHQRVFAVGSSDRGSLLAGLGFDAAVWELWPYLSCGASVAVGAELSQTSGSQLMEWLDRSRVTVTFIPTAMVEPMLANRLKKPKDLRLILTGGERLRNRPTADQGWRLVNNYGPTEAAVVSSWGAVEADQGDGKGRYPCIGRAIDNAQLLVLGKRGEPTAIGVVGELYIGGAGLARGYLGQPAATAERFVPDGLSGATGARLYRTGDQVRWLGSGQIEYVGRIDGQVKLRGYRIELGEIEAALGEHEAIGQAIVTLREDGEGQTKLIAYVVRRTDANGLATGVGDQDLVHYLSERLPAYMVPSAIVTLAEMPLTSNGKVDRNALPSPDEACGDAARTVNAPRTAAEEILAGIWREVLGVGEAGVDEDFFDLGGHSLLATMVMSRVLETFQVDLPLREFFATPTIEGLASRIDEARSQGGELQSPPLTRSQRDGDLPLSFAQQRLWFIDQMLPDSPLYNIPIAMRWHGPLAVAALERSFRAVQGRHESLRTSFVSSHGRPHQTVSAMALIQLPLIDLQYLPAELREVALLTLANDLARRPFHLDYAPLMRVCLIRLGKNEHALLLTMHHIISDGWSLEILIGELQHFYRQEMGHGTGELPELPIQYADYAQWQRQWLQGEALEQQIGYWRNHLSGAAMLELPTDHRRPSIQNYTGAMVGFALPEELTHSLLLLSQEQNVTLFMTLLASWSVLLSRYSQQEDISLGSPIANRTRSELEGLIGFFVNTLVLRLRMEGRPSFLELLGRVREVCLGAYDHQETPFEKLVEELSPERDLSHDPLFQVTFTLQTSRQNPTAAGTSEKRDSAVGALEINTGSSQFDLSMTMVRTSEGLKGAIHYKTQLFQPETISRMAENYWTLLESIIANPERTILDLPLLRPAAIKQMLSQWNETAAEFPDKSLGELFQEQAARTPNNVAIICEDGKLTWTELNQRVNQLAHYLQSRGVGPEVIVGICIERSAAMVIGLLGILKAGGAYLPLDPDYPKDRLAYMIEDAGAKILLTHAPVRASLTECRATIVDLDLEWRSISDQSEANPKTAVSADNLVYVIYTSGSTGKPKGAMLGHRGVVNCLYWMQSVYHLDSFDRVLLKASLSFDASVWELFWPLIVGATVVVAGPGGHKDSAYLVDTVRRHSVTMIHFVPSMLSVFLEEEGLPAINSLKQVVCGGEALPTETLERFHKRLSCPLHNYYGPTETSIGSIDWTCRMESDLSTVPIGRPIANTQVYILDDRLRPVVIGARGELCIGGAGLAWGYMNRPDLTAEKFIPDCWGDVPGQRLYRTGDVVRYRSDGNVEFLGRIDHQIKLRGLRIELGEVETALACHPAVRESMVMVREDKPGDKRLTAYLIARQGITLSLAELLTCLRRELPAYMIPSSFVVLQNWPLMPNGKVDRKALPLPEVTRLGSASVVVKPRTATEELLAAIWAKLLSVDEIGVYDNFFELGGHSLLATQLMSRVRVSFQVSLPLRRLFESPTVAELAAVIDNACRGEVVQPAPSITAADRDRELPLSFAQQRLWFINQLDTDSASYNSPSSITLDGHLSVPALRQSLSEIIQRHESLRTRFEAVDGLPIQVVCPYSSVVMPQVDLSALDDELRGRAVRLLCRDEGRRPFDLSRGPLLRALLLRLGSQEHVLLLTVHHIVFDAWSARILNEELTTLYEAYREGRPCPLEALPIQYADYACWQRQWLQGEILDQQLDYWKRRLAGAPTSLELPADRPRPDRQTFQGGYQSMILSPTLSQTLKALSRSEGATHFMTLLAAFKTLLYRYTGQQDVVVGTPIANRNQPEIERLIGFFSNTLVLRTDLSGNPTFRELIGRVREVALGAYAHQDLPFEKLVEELRPDRSLSRTPLYQVVFALQNVDIPNLKLSGLTLGAGNPDPGPTPADFILLMRDVGDRFAAWTVYNSEIFESTTIAQFLRHYEIVLESATADPDSRLLDIQLFSQASSAAAGVADHSEKYGEHQFSFG